MNSPNQQAQRHDYFDTHTETRLLETRSHSPRPLVQVTHPHPSGREPLCVRDVRPTRVVFIQNLTRYICMRLNRRSKRFKRSFCARRCNIWKLVTRCIPFCASQAPSSTETEQLSDRDVLSCASHGARCNLRVHSEVTRTLCTRSWVSSYAVFLSRTSPLLDRSGEPDAERERGARPSPLHPS